MSPPINSADQSDMPLAISAGGRLAGKPEWRCTQCSKLLGVAKGNQLHIRVQKHREYLVGFPVTANCHGCGTLNEKSVC